MDILKSVLWGHAFRKLSRSHTGVAVLIAIAINASARGATQYFAGDGSLLTASKYGTSAAGPFTSAFASGNIIDFGVANGTGKGGSITVGGIIATENFTLTSASGTISNVSNGVVDINVSAGKTLDFGAENLSGSSTGGYTKSGDGILGLAGNTYGGGFTLSAGTVVAEGVNALGSGGTGTLTINGGAIAGSSSRNFATKYSGITVNGDFQIGALATAVSIASSTANLTFGNDVALGGFTREITIGANGTYTFSGTISGAAGTGLTVNALSGATGALTLSGANAYTGTTTINSGKLIVANTTGSATGTGGVTIGINGTLASGSGSVGTISGPVTTNDRTSIIAPGATAASNTGTVGALTLSGGLDLSAGARIPFDLGANTAASDSITLAGAVTSGATIGAITFDFNNVGATNGTKYALIDASGASSISGFTASAFAATGIAGTFSVGNKTLYFTASVPEPATLLGGALVVGLLGWSQRRRIFAAR